MYACVLLCVCVCVCVCACMHACLHMMYSHLVLIFAVFSIFDLVNIHLFHDASNIIAMQSVSIIYIYLAMYDLVCIIIRMQLTDRAPTLDALVTHINLTNILLQWTVVLSVKMSVISKEKCI